MLVVAYGEHALENHTSLSGSKNSKDAILMWETNNVLYHRQCLKTAKIVEWKWLSNTTALR